MSIFNKVSKSFQWGDKTVILETGEFARQASGAVLVNIDDTVVLPAHRRLHRENVRRRQDSWQLLQARSQAERA